MGAATMTQFLFLSFIMNVSDTGPTLDRGRFTFCILDSGDGVYSVAGGYGAFQSVETFNYNTLVHSHNHEELEVRAYVS